MLKEKGKRKKGKVGELAAEYQRKRCQTRPRINGPSRFVSHSLFSLLSFFLFPFSFFLFPFSSAQGALDAETNKPYRLQVVLHIAENRLLTPVFRDLVERQLRDSLQAALGDLANVEIVRAHPLLKEVEAKGLQLALDGYSALSDTKTHFVLIDFVDGRYEIQARQHDGFTGLASPAVRHSPTADRELVARSAALLVDLDFGLAGTVEDKIAGDKVDVRLKGGGLGVPLGHCVQKGQVFAVAQITQGGAQQRSFRMPWTLLQVQEEPRDGVCRCQLLYRKGPPLPSARSVLGYRCLKLGTTKAPLRLRLVKDERLKSPFSGLQVLISAKGFQGTTLDATSTQVDGLVKSQHAYENVAFVKVFDGEQPLARVPVEIVEDLTIACPVSVNPEMAAQEQLLHRRKRWTQRLYDSLEVVRTVVNELNAMLVQSRSSEDVLTRAQEGLKVVQADISTLTEERASLRQEAKGTPLDFTESEERLQELQVHRQALQKFITDLEEAIKVENDPKRKKWKEMVARGRLQEGEAEFDNAIALYEQVLAESGKDPQLHDYVDTLKRAWNTKSEEHAKARKFIYETWPKLETAAQMKARLDDARKAFLTCKEAGDILSPRKLLKAYGTHTARLEKEVEALQRQDKEDDRNTAETIIALTDDLKNFNDEVRKYLSTAKPPGK